jgi:negative regulator of sigma E activity
MRCALGVRGGALLLAAGLTAMTALLGAAPALAGSSQHGAGRTAAAAPGPDDSARAVALLRRAQAAHTTIAYRGTRIVTAWWGPTASQATTVVLNVRHVPGEGTAFRVRGGSTASPAETFVTQREIAAGSRAALEGGPLRLLIANYSLQVAGSAKVAGRPAAVVTAVHRGVATARFWIDRATGLLLRREVYDADGRLSHASAFVNVRIDSDSVIRALPPMMPQPMASVMSVSQLPRLVAAGWHCPRSLPDGFALTDVHRMHDASQAVQASYSDGLSTVSVFQQHGRLDADAFRDFARERIGGGTVYVKYGLPTYLSWAADGTVFTAVTDAPATYVRQVVLSYPHRQPVGQLGFWSRLWRGIGRLMAWAAPLAVRV